MIEYSNVRQTCDCCDAQVADAGYRRDVLIKFNGRIYGGWMRLHRALKNKVKVQSWKGLHTRWSKGQCFFKTRRELYDDVGLGGRRYFPKPQLQRLNKKICPREANPLFYKFATLKWPMASERIIDGCSYHGR